jgi:hypothetical protein
MKVTSNVRSLLPDRATPRTAMAPGPLKATSAG